MKNKFKEGDYLFGVNRAYIEDSYCDKFSISIYKIAGVRYLEGKKTYEYGCVNEAGDFLEFYETSIDNSDVDIWSTPRLAAKRFLELNK